MGGGGGGGGWFPSDYLVSTQQSYGCFVVLLGLWLLFGCDNSQSHCVKLHNINRCQLIVFEIKSIKGIKIFLRS